MMTWLLRNKPVVRAGSGDWKESRMATNVIHLAMTFSFVAMWALIGHIAVERRKS